MTKWINRSAAKYARNGGSSFTVTYTAATAGNVLMMVNEASAVVTASGWTKRCEALNNTHLVMWTKTATAGEASTSVGLSAPNYPLGAVVYEFPSGTTFVTSNSAVGASPTNDVNPSITGLTPPTLTFAALGMDRGGSAPATHTYTWQTGTNDVDYDEDPGATSGYTWSVAYVEDQSATSYAPAITGTNFGTASLTPAERMTWAMKVPAVQGGSVAAVRATAVAAANPPFVNGSGAALVAAVVATATALMPVPVVFGETAVQGGGPGTASAAMLAPSVSATGSGTVAALPAAAVAAVLAPTVYGQNLNSALVMAPAAQATARGWLPTVVGHGPTVTPTPRPGISTTRVSNPGIARESDEFYELTVGGVTASPPFRACVLPYGQRPTATDWSTDVILDDAVGVWLHPASPGYYGIWLWPTTTPESPIIGPDDQGSAGYVTRT